MFGRISGILRFVLPASNYVRYWSVFSVPTDFKFTKGDLRYNFFLNKQKINALYQMGNYSTHHSVSGRIVGYLLCNQIKVLSKCVQVLVIFDCV